MDEYRTLCINPDNPEEIRKLEADIKWVDVEHRQTGMHRMIIAEM